MSLGLYVYDETKNVTLQVHRSLSPCDSVSFDQQLCGNASRSMEIIAIISKTRAAIL